MKFRGIVILFCYKCNLLDLLVIQFVLNLWEMKMILLLVLIYYKFFCNKCVLLFYIYLIMLYVFIKNLLFKEEKMNGLFKLLISFFLNLNLSCFFFQKCKRCFQCLLSSIVLIDFKYRVWFDFRYGYCCLCFLVIKFNYWKQIGDYVQCL